MFGLSASMRDSGTPTFCEIPHNVDVNVGHGVTVTYFGVGGVATAGAILATGIAVGGFGVGAVGTGGTGAVVTGVGGSGPTPVGGDASSTPCSMFGDGTL